MCFTAPEPQGQRTQGLALLVIFRNSSLSIFPGGEHSKC